MFKFNGTYGARICYAPENGGGADDVNIDDVINQNNNDDNDLDAGIDTGSGIKEGSDLDKKLDDLIGVKTNGTKTAAADVKGKTAADETVDANGKKPGEEGYIAPQQRTQPNNRPNSERTYQPRTYPKAYASDAKGNVILKATGEIVATAGGGRNAFERMLPLISNAQSEAEKYKGLYEVAEKSNAIAASLKLSPEEYSIGARIMATYKSDPKKAIAFMVQEAQNNGVDVSDLGVGGGGISVSAIEQLLDNKLKAVLEPFNFITADRQQQEQEREATLAAEQSIGQFFETFPDAEIHQDAIAKIMNTKSGEIDIEKAYWILNAHAAKNGLDWTKPLAPQITAKLGKTPNNQPANNGRRLPDLGGRPHNESIVERKPTVMSGMSSSSDIVKEAMRDAGMHID